MQITVNGTMYTLSTKLRTAMALEQRFKKPVMVLFGALESVDVTELLDIITIAHSGTQEEKKTLRAEILESFDYIDIFNAVQEVVIGILFSGSAEGGAKIDKLPVPEEQKNVIRGLLNLPPKNEASTGTASPASDTQSESLPPDFGN